MIVQEQALSPRNPFAMCTGRTKWPSDRERYSDRKQMINNRENKRKMNKRKGEIFPRDGMHRSIQQIEKWESVSKLSRKSQHQLQKQQQTLKPNPLRLKGTTQTIRSHSIHHWTFRITDNDICSCLTHALLERSINIYLHFIIHRGTPNTDRGLNMIVGVMRVTNHLFKFSYCLLSNKDSL